MGIDRTFYNALVDDSGSNTDGSVWDKADILDLLNAIDAYVTGETSFTPTWVNVTLGNGTTSGKYGLTSNNRVWFYALLVLGTTSSVTGSIALTLPIAPAVFADSQLVGQTNAYDASAVAHYPGSAILISATDARMVTGAQPAAAMNATTPFTWATSDQLYVTGTYLKA